MGFREMTTRFVASVKEALDLEPELGSATLVSQFAELKLQVLELQGQLEETRRALKEKDELIAKLQAAQATREPATIVTPAMAPDGEKKARPHRARKRPARPSTPDEKE